MPSTRMLGTDFSANLYKLVGVYEKALREIAYAHDPPGDTWSEGVEWAGKIARKALASALTEDELNFLEDERESERESIEGTFGG